MMYLLLLLLGCNGCGSSPVDETPTVSIKEKPDVVLILIEALRADHLMPYGYERETSKNLQAFSEGAVVFEHAYTHASWTRPAVASMLTSSLPDRHRLQTRDDEVENGPMPLHIGLRHHGYTAHAVVSSPYIAPAKNVFMRGYASLNSDGYDPKHKARGVSSPAVTKAALDVWKGMKADPGPQFMLVQYSDPFPMHRAHESHPFGEGPVDRYDSEIAFTDQHLGQLLEAVGDDAMVVIVGTHGFDFDKEDDTLSGDGHSLQEELVRVPLMIRVPGLRPERIKRRVQLIDLAPTLLRLGGMKPPQSFQGKAWRTNRFGVLEVGRRVIRMENKYRGNQRAVIKGHHKLVEDRETETFVMYDLQADPGEETNLVGDPEQQKIFDELFALLP